MCGIIGVKLKSGYNKEIVTDNIVELLEESKIRGIHSFGWSYMERSKVFTRKYFTLGTLINDVRKDVRERMIFHNRYATSGNWEDIKNNQPIQIGNRAIAFNGVIDMGTQDEMEAKYCVKMMTENDAELALLHMETLPTFVKGKSFSGVMLYDGRLVHYRNPDRPAAMHEDEHAIYIASTKDIFKRAMNVEATDTIPNQLWEY